MGGPAPSVPDVPAQTAGEAGGEHDGDGAGDGQQAGRGNAPPPGGGRPGGALPARRRVVIQGEQQSAAGDVPVSAVTVRAPDAPALPHARQLLRALRQFRYDQGRRYDWDERHPSINAGPGQFRDLSGRFFTPDALDEEGTAQLIAQTGMRLPVLRTTKRRRFDLELVLDTGGSGLMWTKLAVELRSVLSASGAFRVVRPWTLGTDSAGPPPLRAGDVLTGQPGQLRYTWDSADRSRKPLVMLLTDGTGQGWRTGLAGAALRDWAARKNVVVVQLLPPEMWDRTRLRVLPVRFRPDPRGYHPAGRLGVSDGSLLLAGVRRAELPRCTAFPVISLDAGGLTSWLPLLHSADKAEVFGHALLVPPDPVNRGAPAHPDGEAAGRDDADEDGGDDLGDLDDREGRGAVHQFLLSASADARRLARLLSVIDPLNLPGIRRVRHQLLPGSSPYILAEVLLGGLLHWTPTTAAASLAGQTPLYWNPGVQDVLRERPGGLKQLQWDQALVIKALEADAGALGFSSLTVAVPDPAGAPAAGEALRAAVVTADGPDRAAAPADGGPQRAGTAAAVVEPVAPEEPPRPVRPLRPDFSPGPIRTSRPGDGPELAALAIDDLPEPAEGEKRPPAALLQIGIWGSTASGRTVYVTALCKLGLAGGWFRWKKELWRVVPSDPATQNYIEGIRVQLEVEGLFPRGNSDYVGQRLNFRIERVRPRPRPPFGWLRPERSASITTGLQDWPGGTFQHGERQSPAAVEYLTKSDVLLYFYDPVLEPSKSRPFDYFDDTVLELSRAAIQRGTLYQGRLPQQLAVCLPKLDDQDVFDLARSYDCVKIDSATGLPWVPPELARRLFEEITFKEGTIDADYLRREIGRVFHPGRTSYHAFTSIGFWTPGGRLDLDRVCRVEPAEPPAASPARVQASPASPARRRLRSPGELNPVHIMDPIIAVVERASRRGGAR
jgi:hypothetical protein